MMIQNPTNPRRASWPSWDLALSPTRFRRTGQTFSGSASTSRDFPVFPVGAEVRSVTWGELECKNPYQITIDVAMMMKDAADAAGVPIIGVASPFLKCNWDDEAAIAEHLEGLRHCLDLAGIWEAGFVRVFNLWLPKDMHQYVPAFARGLQIFQQEVRSLLPLYPGIRLGIENETTTVAFTAHQTAHFLQRVEMEELGIIWDPANEVAALGEDILPFPDSWEIVRDRAFHIHAKDGKGRGAYYESTIFGEGGVIDWPGQLKVLVEDEHQFWVSLETHWRMGEEHLPKAVTDQPGGADFTTAAAEASSRICMTNLSRMLKEA